MYLRGNPLRNFTAVNLPALTTLPIASFEVLESLVLTDLPELVSINVYGNELSELVLPFLPKLASLDARANQLTSIVLESSKLPALQNLYLAGNQLVELELDGFTELRDVDLGGNALQTLVLRNLPKITTVYNGTGDSPDGNAVWVQGNPLVKVFYDFPEDSSDGSGGTVSTIPVPWWPQNLRVEFVGDGVDGRGSFTARWDAPEQEGDSAVEGYTVTVSHPRVPPSVPAWEQSYEVTRSIVPVRPR